MGAADDRLVVTPTVRVPRHELEVSFAASGGPGGQHANKAATRVELSYDVVSSAAFADEDDRRRVVDRLGPVVRVVADDERSQVRNRRIAEERLVERLRGALHVPKRRRATRPTRGSQRRRLDTKGRRGELKRTRRRPTLDD